VEHLEENGKPCLYLVFEYLSTDLKKFMDRTGKGPANPLPVDLVKVRGGAGWWGGWLAGRLLGTLSGCHLMACYPGLPPSWAGCHQCAARQPFQHPLPAGPSHLPAPLPSHS
jgi:hypothetical protein